MINQRNQGDMFQHIISIHFLPPGKCKTAMDLRVRELFILRDMGVNKCISGVWALVNVLRINTCLNECKVL